MGSPNKLGEYGKDMLEFVEQLWSDLEQHSPVPDVKPGFLLERLPQEAPEKPQPWNDIMADVKNIFVPGMTQFHNPNFHAYFEAGTSAASVVGDMLANSLATPTFSWQSGPASTELEMRMMDWFGKMLNLPDEFIFSSEKNTGGGVIQESNTGALTLMFTAAKMRLLRQLRGNDLDINPYDVTSKLVVFTSDQAHVSVQRVGTVTGIRVRTLQTDEKGSLRGETLKEAIKQAENEGLFPLLVCATSGTTSTCAFDNLQEIGEICQSKEVWLHVDAAYAGSFCVCPEFRPLINGVQYVDSICIGPQKAMRVHLPYCGLWVRDRYAMERTFDDDPIYLKHNYQNKAVDYKNWSLYLTRPCRPLKMWFVLRLLGIEELQKHLRKQVRLAHEFEALVRSDDRFEIVADVILGLVCFRLKGPDELSKRLLEMVNDQGKIFINFTEYKGRYVIRFPICSAAAESRHMTFAWSIIADAANEVQSEHDQEGLLLINEQASELIISKDELREYKKNGCINGHFLQIR
ncbi:aromatic-L-amino-acid decarboxylase-like isoform X1 [Lytechinus variegatus]|uniref:aromatic-L-amino-acid decarboxylase-like isoform X1 n=1 Tax=Lytechinus variegatus TaxID=7654 RepID=UPI001BB26F6D|nr:aromatic-L-amino-acid decarboxylase-like isoform X1 [Lytechinus variegatus]XP_041455781.1 aromatic-L-amino-acid decarboxylase-like isoform X1 [Lytechinus variegatus]